MNQHVLRARQLKPVVFVLLCLPALWLLYEMLISPESLGADPAKTLVGQSGLWAVKAILLALAITPLRIVTGQSAVLIYRRMVGLFAFFYACVHFAIYSVLLLELDFSRLGHELTTRPYIIVGAIALLAYFPLAITSTHAWQRRLGRNWATLHRLVYMIGLFAVIHFTWSKKIGIAATWGYVVVLLLLLAIRLWRRYLLKRNL